MSCLFLGRVRFVGLCLALSAGAFSQAPDDARPYLSVQVVEMGGAREYRLFKIKLTNEDYQYQIRNMAIKLTVVTNEGDGPSRPLSVMQSFLPPRGSCEFNASVNFGSGGLREPGEVSIRGEATSARFFLYQRSL